MLKGIPGIIPPELLKVLCEMGHSDRICIADGNFPAVTIGKNATVIRLDGHGVPEVLDAILTLLPLDTYVDHPAILMELMERDVGRIQTPIWDKYAAIIEKHDERGRDAMGHIDRFDFYEEAGKCCCIVATGESAVYANVILQKGVI